MCDEQTSKVTYMELTQRMIKRALILKRISATESTEFENLSRERLERKLYDDEEKLFGQFWKKITRGEDTEIRMIATELHYVANRLNLIHKIEKRKWEQELQMYEDGKKIKYFGYPAERKMEIRDVITCNSLPEMSQAEIESQIRINKRLDKRRKLIERMVWIIWLLIALSGVVLLLLGWKTHSPQSENEFFTGFGLLMGAILPFTLYLAIIYTLGSYFDRGRERSCPRCLRYRASKLIDFVIISGGEWTEERWANDADDPYATRDVTFSAYKTVNHYRCRFCSNEWKGLSFSENWKLRKVI